MLRSCVARPSEAFNQNSGDHVHDLVHRTIDMGVLHYGHAAAAGLGDEVFLQSPDGLEVFGLAFFTARRRLLTAP